MDKTRDYCCYSFLVIFLWHGRTARQSCTCRKARPAKPFSYDRPKSYQPPTVLQQVDAVEALLTHAAVLVPCHCAEVGTRRSPRAADVGNLGLLGD